MDMYEYIERVTEQLRTKKARDMVAKELRAHIEDQTEAYLAEGMEKTEASEKAVGQMGDPVEVGISLDKIHRPQTDYKMIVILAVVCVIGLLLPSPSMFAVSFPAFSDSVEQSVTHVSFSMVLTQIPRLSILLLAPFIFVVWFICRVDYSVSVKYAFVITAALIALLWLGRAVFPTINGGHPYLRSFLYLFAPLYGGMLYRLRGMGFRGFAGSVLLLFGIVCATLPVVGAGIGLRFLFAAAVTLSFAVCYGWFGEKIKTMLAVIWCGGAAGLFIMVEGILHRGGFTAYRILAILHPEDYADTYGYYVLNMRKWLTQFKMWGNPEAAGDFLHSNISIGGAGYLWGNGDVSMIYLCLKYGIVAGILISGAYLFCIGYFLRKCLKQKNQLGRVIGTGCCFAFLTEFTAYMLNGFGIIPSSAGLPLLSFGAASDIVWAVLIGYIFSIIRYQNLIPADGAEQKKRYRLRVRFEKVEL